jgi:hypothetical protein
MYDAFIIDIEISVLICLSVLQVVPEKKSDVFWTKSECVRHLNDTRIKKIIPDMAVFAVLAKESFICTKRNRRNYRVQKNMRVSEGMRFCKKKSDGTFEVISEIFNIFLDILSMF